MKKLALSIFLVLEVFSTSRPNIILVMSDDHGYGDCGFTGHPFVQTPHLDNMAKSGVVFNRFYSSAPVCSPTRAVACVIARLLSRKPLESARLSVSGDER